MPYHGRGTPQEHIGARRAPIKPSPCANGNHLGGATPFLVSTSHGDGKDKNGKKLKPNKSRVRSAEDPAPTLAASAIQRGVVTPFLVSTNHGNGEDANGKPDHRRVKSIDEPLPTVNGQGGEYAVIR